MLRRLVQLPHKLVATFKHCKPIFILGINNKVKLQKFFTGPLVKGFVLQPKHNSFTFYTQQNEPKTV